MDESMVIVQEVTWVDVGGLMFCVLNMIYLLIFILAVVFHRRLYQRLNLGTRLAIAFVYVAGITYSGSILCRSLILGMIEEAGDNAFNGITRWLLSLAAFALVLILRFLLPEHRRQIRDSSFTLVTMLILAMIFALYLNYRFMTNYIDVDNYRQWRVAVMSNGMLAGYLAAVLGLAAVFAWISFREWRKKTISATNLALFLGIMFLAMELPVLPFVGQQRMNEHFTEYLAKYPELPGMTAEEGWRYQRAIDKGDAESQYQLAFDYITGEGVPQDLAKAVRWYLEAAEQGHAKAQYRLGLCYEYGDGMPKDMAKAVEWYRKAAEQGHAKAQYSLGFCYDEYGDGMPKDMAKAVEWYRKAAEQGFDSAQFCLGSCYLEGDGVPKDVAKAEEWFRKAAEQGHEMAIQELKRLD